MPPARNFAVSPETRRDSGLGERVSDALPLEGLQTGVEALVALDPVQSRLGGGDSAVDGERIVER